MPYRNEILRQIRELMKERGIGALLFPATDPHLGEYIPDHWKIIEWMTGFTGSAANVVITADFAGLWTDSRYFIQAESQLAGSGYELVRLKVPHTAEYIDWMASNLKSGNVVATDGRVAAIGLIKQMRNSFISMGIEINHSCDLVSPLWTERPPMPSAMAFEHELSFAGISRDEKIESVRRRMAEMGAAYHLLTSLDDIAWLLNIRGSDVNYSPLLTSYMLIMPGQLLLFVDEDRIPSGIKRDFDRSGVTILPYEETGAILESLSPDESILITPATTSIMLFDSIPSGMRIMEDISIPTRMKAVKNRVEQENIMEVMIRDGVALTMFFHWLETNIGKERITEISAADKLLEFRSSQLNFVGPSFATIAAFNEHGALPHYTSTAETDVELAAPGIFLLDSGGQYLDGTTDVTRTIALGKPTDRQRVDFTLALKGTINLAMVRFPYGTRGYQVEVLARKALWDNGMNYGHGTGHGVGCFLNVHEGPQTIGTGASGDLKTILEPGMLTADEPAIYREGEYGFRTENLILCMDDRVTSFGRFLRFRTVTLCYIDQNLLEPTLLNPQEIDWLNDYHKKVYNRLSPHLSDSVKQWLEIKTAPIILKPAKRVSKKK